MKDRIFIIDKSDAKNVWLKRLLEAEGYMALDYGENTYDFVGSVVYVFSPAKTIDLSAAVSLRTGGAVFGGKLADLVAEEFAMRGIAYHAVMDDEAYAHKNARLTAEGALEIILRETDFSLASLSAMVLGYGRIGKALCKLLDDLGCQVTAVTTTPEEEILAGVYLRGGCIPLGGFEEELGSSNVVVNTIPRLVLGCGALEKADPSALFIDLASKPGGIDFACAQRLGIKAVHALGVPGSYAPRDAARYLMERILGAL